MNQNHSETDTMSTTSLISNVAFVAATPADRETGLLGFITVVVFGIFKIDGVTLRRTLEGRTAISWPERRTASGRVAVAAHPIDAATQRRLDGQILAALGQDAEATH